MLNGRGSHEDQRDMKWMKDMSLTFSSQSLTVTIPSMSSLPLSNRMDCTAWAPSVSTSPITSTSCFPINTSPSTKKGNSPIGSSKALPVTPCTQQCTTTPELRKTGELQLSSKGTMTCILKLPPWLQSKGVLLLPLKPPKYSWTKASDTCSDCMHMSGTNSSAPSTRALTSTPNPGGSSPLSLAAHTAVQLDPSQRVMS